MINRPTIRGKPNEAGDTAIGYLEEKKAKMDLIRV